MSVDYSWPSSLPGPADDNYSWSEEPRVRMAKFGDGYEQRTNDGLNTRPRSLTMDWPNLVRFDKDTLLNFLRARNGVQAFWWMPPGETTPIKIKAPKWTVKRKSGPYWTVTVEFVEIFDVGSTPAAPTNTVAPAISGSTHVGGVLTVSDGTWTGFPNMTYQWYANGVAISGATASAYTLTSNEIGKTITCSVTGTNISGSVTATSPATATIAA